MSGLNVLTWLTVLTLRLRASCITIGWRGAVLVVLVLLSTACARVTAPQVEEVGTPDLSAAQMLEIMERSYTHAGLQALAEVQLRRGKDKQSSTQALHVQAPYHLRAEVYNFMGQMMVMLTANGARLQAYVPSRKTLYSGMATRQRMEQFAYVPLMPADMVALLLQRLPSGVMQLARVEKGTGNRLRFIISDHQEYVVGFDADQVRRIAYTELDGEVFSITYAPEAPINMEGDSFPRKMVLEIPAQELTLDIELEDVQLNPDIEPDLFEIKERAGVKSLLLEDF